VDSHIFKDICENFLREPVRYHRKLWEFVYIVHILREHGMLKPGKRGIGFGCGEERLIPVFAASGAKVLITDLDGKEAAKRGWVETNQHLSSLQVFDKYLPSVCHPEVFKQNVRHGFVDMNHIPRDLLQGDYDFTWSSCSLEHLGTLKDGEEFILNSLKTLKPGGIAVHTTEYNVSSNSDTVVSGSTVIYRRKDIERIVQRAKQLGYRVSAMDFSTGNLAADNYVDLPPYKQETHLKLKIQQYNCTSIGMFFERPQTGCKPKIVKESLIAQPRKRR
jgi:hypothetical protein